MELLFPQPPVFFKCLFLKLEKYDTHLYQSGCGNSTKNPLGPHVLKWYLHNFTNLGSCHQTWVMNVFFSVTSANAQHRHCSGSTTSACFASLSVWRVVHKPSNCSCLEGIRSVVDFPPSKELKHLIFGLPKDLRKRIFKRTKKTNFEWTKNPQNNPQRI